MVWKMKLAGNVARILEKRNTHKILFQEMCCEKLIFLDLGIWGLKKMDLKGIRC
jgi:hypothetical protein